MKYTVSYKSKIDGKSRKEIKESLRDLTNFFLKINFYTNYPYKVTIQSFLNYKEKA